MEKICELLKLAVTAAGALYAVIMLFMCFYTDFNLGNVMLVGLGAAAALWFNVPHSRVFFVLKLIFIAGILLILALCAFIALNAYGSKTSYDEDAVIVLGCAVRGTVPTNTLRSRLNTCIDYAGKNPSALIVVSGGQGPGEDISEAEAMKAYLVSNGIAAERIYAEDKSTSTKENFLFSKNILDELFDYDYSVCYITNDFHCWRAGGYAKKAGLSVKCCGAPTSLRAIPPCYAREALAALYYIVFEG